MSECHRFVGVGIYSIPQAARITGISSRTIRRWAEGYTYISQDSRRRRPAVWQRQLPNMDGQIALGFRDLIEVRFVEGFRKHGVSLQVIRKAAEIVAGDYDETHPFSTRRFKTDGKRLLELIDDQRLLDVISGQYGFRDIITPYLRGLQYITPSVAGRWWVEGHKKRIVLDPAINFGRPTVARTGTPTEVLYAAYGVQQSYAEVAKWYEVPETLVREAVSYEESPAA